jgi:hypothetical protein
MGVMISGLDESTCVARLGGIGCRAELERQRCAGDALGIHQQHPRPQGTT